MPWYTYFLISLPEMYFITLLGLTLFGIRMQSRWVQIHVYSILTSIMSFFASIFIENPNNKLLILIVVLILSYWGIFRLKVRYSILVVVTSMVFFMILQMICSVLYSEIIKISLQQLLENEAHKIAAAWVTFSVIYLNVYVFAKYKLHIRFAGLSEMKK